MPSPRRRVLDSSPVAVRPPAPPTASEVPLRRPLKRTASMVSLPTPPRTVGRKKKRTRGAAADLSSDSDREDAPDSSPPPKKRQRLAPAADDEDAFWLGDGHAAGSTGAAGTSRRGTVLESPPGLLLRASRTHALMSPPPSRVGPKTAGAPPMPVTPPRRSPRKKSAAPSRTGGWLGPIRDPVSNPFLDSDLDASPGGTVSMDEASPSPRTPAAMHVEKPTLTYVFRGVKATFANPLFNVSPEEHALSLLPPEHPDFEPSELCPPRLLFPSARRQPARRAKQPAGPPSAPPRTPSPTRRSRRTAVRGDDTDDELHRELPKKLLFEDSDAVARAIGWGRRRR